MKTKGGCRDGEEESQRVRLILFVATDLHKNPN